MSSIKVLGELNTKREKLVDKLSKLDAEIDEYRIKGSNSDPKSMIFMCEENV